MDRDIRDIYGTENLNEQINPQKRTPLIYRVVTRTLIVSALIGGGVSIYYGIRGAPVNAAVLSVAAASIGCAAAAVGLKAACDMRDVCDMRDDLLSDPKSDRRS